MNTRNKTTIRCAIYTRKSSEEGLEQSFNSLQAQREACEAYIASQRHEGWHGIRTHYDDGGYSGGSTDRPDLQRLLDDIRARKIDVMMADTAGRLPTQLHLMEELRKVKRVIGKAQDDAPHEVLLVIDANTGQNALAQVKAFDDALGLTGLIVTKLDGTAKGGILAAIARQRPIPVYFIGVGEKVEDLQPFSAEEFSDALLGG